MSINNDLITAMGLVMSTSDQSTSNQKTNWGIGGNTLTGTKIGNGVWNVMSKPNIQYVHSGYTVGIDPFEDIKDKLESQKKKLKEAMKNKMQFDDMLKEVREWKIKK